MRKKFRRKNNHNRQLIIISITILLLLTTGYAAFQTNVILNAKGNIKDRTRIIKSWKNYRINNIWAENTPDFHNDEYREKIISITFLDSASVPNDAVMEWDVSEIGDKGVIAYIIDSKTNTGMYDLFIGAKGGVIGNEDCTSMFNTFTNVTQINFNNNFNTSNVKTMNGMFTRCINLLEIDLSSFDTSNVEDMTNMFYNCKSLTKLDLTKFITLKVTTMNRMFYGCSKLNELNISTFNTSNVEDMSYMFAMVSQDENSSLTKLNLNNFNTIKVTNMSGMFSNCYGLQEIDISSFNTSSVENITYMFNRCFSLNKIYVSNNFTTSKVKSSDNMFINDTNLVGGHGTVYNPSYIDKTYARVDTASTPGYFTLK